MMGQKLNNKDAVSLILKITPNICIKTLNVLQFMKNYTKIKVLRITEKQYRTLIKMKTYKVDVSEFIRQAIKEKIKRDYKELIPKPKKQYTPF